MIRAKKEESVLLERYYNPDLKDEFIKEYNDGNSEKYTWNSIFLRSAPMEEIRDKDCCNFTYEEIERLLFSFRSVSVQRLSVILSLLSTYTDFCISRRFSIDNQNHYREIQRPNLAKYVDKRKAEYVYLTEDDVMEICNVLESYRDKYAVLALFNGIIGENFEDLIELDAEDLLGNNKIRIKSTGEIREVTPYLYNIMVQSSEEYEVVFNNNGTWKFTGTKVYKPTLTKNANTNVNKTAIGKRLAKMRVNLKMPMFGPKALIISGFCKEALEYAEANGYTIKECVHTEYVKELRLRYRMPKTDANVVSTLENYKSFIEMKKGN